MTVTSHKIAVVVGSGPTGLKAIRHLSAVCKVICFEMREDIGGLWNYSKDVVQYYGNSMRSPTGQQQGAPMQLSGTQTPSVYFNAFLNDTGCFPDSMYEYLECNIPKHFMFFKDFPAETAHAASVHAGVDPVCSSPDGFFDRADYLRYCQLYAAHFNLKNHISFRRYVTGIYAVDSLSDKERAKYTSGNTGNQRMFVVVTVPSTTCTPHIIHPAEEYTFADYVVIASGHNSIPQMPTIPYEANFAGNILHVHNFRRPDDQNLFVGKTVCVVGGGFSGFEMLVQFFKTKELGDVGVKKLILITRDLADVTPESLSDFEPNLKYKRLIIVEGEVARFGTDKREDEYSTVGPTTDTRTITCTEGSVFENVDTVVYCTGYKYKLPSLRSSDNDSECDMIRLSDSSQYMTNLYLRMFCISRPELMVVGAVDSTCFIGIISEWQCILAKLFISSQIQLPTVDAMLQHEHLVLREYADRAASRGVPDETELSKYFRLSNIKEDRHFMDELVAVVRDTIPVDHQYRMSKLYELQKKICDFGKGGDYARLRTVLNNDSWPIRDNTTAFF
eukprot:GHVQ01015705.1.p1 GENE.GHVQ01015705.1~~GHVQ01015705.1.p1  ORF type:complete len:560 (+),score=57.95 GHVQ01015705.1:184-1863(+)